VRIAAIVIPKVKEGRIRELSPPRPETGSQLSSIDKMIMRSGPSQKLGIARAHSEKRREKRSIQESLLTAAMIPKGKAIRRAIVIAAMVSSRVAGSRVKIRSKTLPCS
jgi:hypothetical protein